MSWSCNKLTEMLDKYRQDILGSKSRYYIRCEENEWLFINWQRVCDISNSFGLKAEWRVSKISDLSKEYIAFCNPSQKSVIDKVLYVSKLY